MREGEPPLKGRGPNWSPWAALALDRAGVCGKETLLDSIGKAHQSLIDSISQSRPGSINLVSPLDTP